jgi:hypothetical protein
MRSDSTVRFSTGSGIGSDRIGPVALLRSSRGDTQIERLKPTAIGRVHDC